MNSPGGVCEEEIDAPGIRDKVALRAAAARVAPFGVLDDPFEIVEVTEHRLLEVGVCPDAGAIGLRSCTPWQAVSATAAIRATSRRWASTDR